MRALTIAVVLICWAGAGIAFAAGGAPEADPASRATVDDFVGSWTGVLEGEGGETSRVVLRVERPPGGPFAVVTGFANAAVAGTLQRGTLRFPGLVEHVEDPDCAGFSVTGTLRLLGDADSAELTSSGIFCAPGGGRPGSFRTTLSRRIITYATQPVAHISCAGCGGPGGSRNVLALADGATLVTELGPAGLTILRGSSANAVARLSQTLDEGRAGIQPGGCGAPLPGGPDSYQITWFGRNGRSSTFQVGGSLAGCPPAIGAIVQAAADLVEEVANDTSTERFP